MNRVLAPARSGLAIDDLYAFLRMHLLGATGFSRHDIDGAASLFTHHQQQPAGCCIPVHDEHRPRVISDSLLGH